MKKRANENHRGPTRDITIIFCRNEPVREIGAIPVPITVFVAAAAAAAVVEEITINILEIDYSISISGGI